VKTAIIMQKGGVDRDSAGKVLAQADGFVKRAIHLLEKRH
jgi:N-acetylmuramic acid 6-phosphate (MurNAc-6-P) etherase